ncbi:putative homocysteine S-methyltransferase [Lyophyllum shimeji]|uniref:Homocysteine S-methyltransferase n=1 Tax=Lyophyllum shimeji TaxID=47721 RepID=A0A9P3PKE6_LYOSH|nr:putative homocysteine S-methyltransferase [Lyophyllum shimeji]
MQIYPTSPVVLDGGLGTTLEELVPESTKNSPLWSAQQILDNPGLVVEAHLAFMRAGARIVLTDTYQASFETFEKAGYSHWEAKEAFLRSVHLADQARASFVSLTTEPSVIVKLGLSLGPFGAGLSPGQEYDGYYPPPYGPAAYSDKEPNRNSFDKDAVEDERRSIQALAKFHLDRLLVFARDPETWKMIDVIAFETIPLVREVAAIRQAMSSLKDALAAEGVDFVPKPWWTSFVLPNGRCPQTQFPGGPNMTVRDLVSAALAGTPTDHATDFFLTPTGIGINCTSPALIPELVQEISWAVEKLRGTQEHAPWLVLYPDGGDIYDTNTRSWVVASQDKKDSWAVNLKETCTSTGKKNPFGTSLGNTLDDIELVKLTVSRLVRENGISLGLARYDHDMMYSKQDARHTGNVFPPIPFRTCFPLSKMKLVFVSVLALVLCSSMAASTPCVYPYPHCSTDHDCSRVNVRQICCYHRGTRGKPPGLCLTQEQCDAT